MTTVLTAANQPRLAARAPTASDVLSRDDIRAFVAYALAETGVREPTVLVINLDGRILTTAALHEIVLGLGSEIREGKYGDIRVVLATPDRGIQDAVAAFATHYELPLWIADSRFDVANARPAVALTTTDRDTLTAVGQLGGRVTAAGLAEFSDLEKTAAGNRLAAAEKRGLLFRVRGSGPVGDMYLDPRAAAPAEQAADPLKSDFNLPAAVRTDLFALAEVQGRQPGDVLLEAMREFLTKHRDILADEYAETADAIRNGDPGRIERVSNRGSRAAGHADARRLPIGE